MNCPSCGAAMEPVGGRAYFRCNYCGTFEFPETDETGVTDLGEASQFACPVCTQSLNKASVHGHTVFFCGTCRGFLTTNANFTAMLACRREEAKESSRVIRPFGKDELRRRIKCPGCQKKMDTHPYGGGGNVVVDTCYRCHWIWFDAGEFDAIANHRTQSTTMSPSHTMLVPQYSGPPREPESGWRWGDGGNDSNSEGGTSLWTLLSRFF
jgi:Zn-finger nucleic acid-binding protein